MGGRALKPQLHARTLNYARHQLRHIVLQTLERLPHAPSFPVIYNPLRPTSTKQLLSQSLVVVPFGCLLQRVRRKMANGNGVTVSGTAGKKATVAVKAGLAQMLKGGVIMDVVDVAQARIAEEAGAVAGTLWSVLGQRKP